MKASSKLAEHILAVVIQDFRKLKKQCEHAIFQLHDDELFFQLNSDQNSVYVIMKHLGGNMLSRWTDFRTTDGEKPDRDRDEEFVERRVSRTEIMAYWESGWDCLLSAMLSVRPDELQSPVVIRGESMSLFTAINRQTAHYAYHTGQIILIAKHIRGVEWKYLTIPRGQSKQYNEKLNSSSKS